MLLIDDFTITEYPPPPTFPPLLHPPTTSTAGTATSMTASHFQTTSIPTSKVAPPLDPTVLFELNKARRSKVTREVETLRSAFLEWPTVEGLEAFVEKRTEYSEMMEDHVSDLHAVIQEHLVFVEGAERAAKLAEERRLQEFRRALERMTPAEAEAAQQAERERSVRLQKEREARNAAWDAEWALERARIRAESR